MSGIAEVLHNLGVPDAYDYGTGAPQAGEPAFSIQLPPPT